jgi:hypothetical protein
MCAMSERPRQGLSAVGRPRPRNSGEDCVPKGLAPSERPADSRNGEAGEEGFGPSAETCAESDCFADQQGSAEEAHSGAGPSHSRLTTNGAHATGGSAR